MKTKALPAVVMLTAGFIDCIFAIYHHQSLMDFTRQLLLVLVIFYLIGCAVKIVLDMNFKSMEDPAPQPEPGDGSVEAAADEEQQQEELGTDLEDIRSEAE